MLSKTNFESLTIYFILEKGKSINNGTKQNQPVKKSGQGALVLSSCNSYGPIYWTTCYTVSIALINI